MSSEYRTNYRDDWEDGDEEIAERVSDVMDLWRLNGDERKSLEGALFDADRREDFLSGLFKEENTVLVGRPEVLESFNRDLDFTNERRVVEGFASAEDVRDRHVIGNLPLDLEAEAASVTTYAVNSSFEQRHYWRAESWSAEEFASMDRGLVTYAVHRGEYDPVWDHPEDMVVVTQDEALVEELRERGVIDPETPVLSHLDDPRDLQGKILVGIGSAEMKLVASGVIAVDHDRATGSYGDVNVYIVDPVMSWPDRGDGQVTIHCDDRGWSVVPDTSLWDSE